MKFNVYIEDEALASVYLSDIRPWPFVLILSNSFFRHSKKKKLEYFTLLQLDDKMGQGYKF